MQEIVNISAYQFVPLSDLPETRRSLQLLCRPLGLKGTILLSAEGINLFVAGSESSVNELLDHLRRIPGLSGLPVKTSRSAYQPFNRMLVKIKREIIAFGRPEIDPSRQPAPRISPRILKQWLDENRDFILLDVRNDYEIAAGTFATAVSAGIQHFRQFPQAVERMDVDRTTPIVMFCTGGIRCEKAAPFLLQSGFDQVYHLDGGILKYFELVGGDHYVGECFVFDKRVALDPSLGESELALCFACKAILGPDDMTSTQYRHGEYCPHCFVEPDQQWRDLKARRHMQIAKATHPLPGSLPYDNVRPLNVAAAFEGYRLIEFLTARHPHIRREFWLTAITEGRIQCDRRPLTAEATLRAGQRLVHLVPQTVEPSVNADIRLLFEDQWLIVVDKPAPLPVHPCGRFNRNSLVRILDEVYRPLYPRPQHRLDADTTGVVVLSKSRRVSAQLQTQFEQKTVRKTYLAKVVGHPPTEDFVLNHSIGRSPGERGCRAIVEQGLECQTLCRVRWRLDDETSIIELQPTTGRTNQIRIQLWESGFPIVGDPMYGRSAGANLGMTLGIEDPPLCLHHARIELRHPISGAEVAFDAPWPKWMPRTPELTESMSTFSTLLGR